MPPPPPGPWRGWRRFPISSMRLAADVLTARARALGSPGIWTRPADVRAAVKRRWDSGTLLTRFAAGRDWEPLGIPIRGPSASLIGERLAEVRQWAAEWAEAARGPLRVEYKQVGGRHVGTNSIPCRAWLDSYDGAWALLRVGADVRRLTELIEASGGTRLIPWLTGHPMRALRLADAWDRLLTTVRWIEQRQVPGMYLRQVDVPGVDTKFIERHRGVLTELLDAQLDPARVDAAAGSGGSTTPSPSWRPPWKPCLPTMSPPGVRDGRAARNAMPTSVPGAMLSGIRQCGMLYHSYVVQSENGGIGSHRADQRTSRPRRAGDIQHLDEDPDGPPGRHSACGQGTWRSTVCHRPDNRCAAGDTRGSRDAGCPR